MPGLIVVSWKAEHGQRANERFERARAAYARLKGLAVSSEVRGATFRAVRLVASCSTCRDFVQSAHAPSHIGIAGWWFDSAVPDGQPPSPAQIAEALATEGESASNRLQGQYLVVSLDARDGKVGAVGDCGGLFPWYVAEDAGVAWVSTSSLALAAALTPKLDVQALRALFMSTAVRSPRSLFEGIRRAGIGERVVLEDGRVQRQQVWMPYRPITRYRDRSEAAEHGICLLQRSIRGVRTVWPRLVSDLTSGLDSRLVVAALANDGDGFGLTVNGPHEGLDVRTCEQISESFGWPLHRVELPGDWGTRRQRYFQDAVALSDGELSGHIADGTVYAKRSLRGAFEASIGGHFGELFRDFFWQQEFMRVGRTSRLDVARVLKYRFFFSSRPEMRLFSSDWREQYKLDQISTVQQIIDGAPDALNTSKLDAFVIWKESGHAGRWTSAMAPIIASPAPLATRALIEFTISVPWKFRIHGNLMREMIARLAPDLASVPTWYGGSALPISLGNPREYSKYTVGKAKKFVRKIGQLTIGHPIFPDPAARPRPTQWNADLVRQLQDEGFLQVNNLRSASLYHLPGLRQLLQEAERPGFAHAASLFTVISIELVCRLCDLRPSTEVI